MSGSLSYHAGLSAEETVALHYERKGLTIAARRWRGLGGEIDVIARDGAKVIFVEVKKSRDFARAAEHLTYNQYQRIWATAGEFLADEPAGQDTDVRLDLAMVDGTGRVEVIENVILD